jgi:hypothetical protein
MSTFLALIMYYYIGLGLVKFIFPDIVKSTNLYTRAYLFSALFMLSYHYLAIYYFYIPSWVHDQEGIFRQDGGGYHEIGQMISTNLSDVSPITNSRGKWNFSWYYLIGINYALFGVNPLVIKILNSCLFSVGTLAIYQLSYFYEKDHKISKRVYYSYLFFLPLLYLNATLMRETFMTTMILLALYNYFKYRETNELKWIILFIVFSLLLLFTRTEYAIMLVGTAILSYIFSTKINFVKKVFFMLLIGFTVFLITLSPLAHKVGIAQSILGQEGSRIRNLNVSKTEKIVADNYGEIVSLLINSPTTFLKPITYSMVHFFSAPPPYRLFRSSTYILIEEAALFTFYNIYFYLLIPGIFFGLYYRRKDLGVTPYDFMLIVLIGLVIIGNGIDLRLYGRYKIPFFPILMLLGVHGTYHYKRWKKHTLLIIILSSFIAVYRVFFFNFHGLVE